MKRIDTTARRRRAKAGTSIVEATIVLPLMLLLVFGIAEFGISFTRWNSLTNAVREGARVGVVFRAPCDPAAVDTLVKATVTNFAASSGITNPINTTVTGPCLGTGTQLTVLSTVPYTYVALSAFSALGIPPIANLGARTVMRNE